MNKKLLSGFMGVLLTVSMVSANGDGQSECKGKAEQEKSWISRHGLLIGSVGVGVGACVLWAKAKLDEIDRLNAEIDRLDRERTGGTAEIERLTAERDRLNRERRRCGGEGRELAQARWVEQELRRIATQRQVIDSLKRRIAFQRDDLIQRESVARAGRDLGAWAESREYQDLLGQLDAVLEEWRELDRQEAELDRQEDALDVQTRRDLEQHIRLIIADKGHKERALATISDRARARRERQTIRGSNGTAMDQRGIVRRNFEQAAEDHPNEDETALRGKILSDLGNTDIPRIDMSTDQIDAHFRGFSYGGPASPVPGFFKTNVIQKLRDSKIRMNKILRVMPGVFESWRDKYQIDEGQIQQWNDHMQGVEYALCGDWSMLDADRHGDIIGNENLLKVRRQNAILCQMTPEQVVRWGMPAWAIEGIKEVVEPVSNALKIKSSDTFLRRMGRLLRDQKRIKQKEDACQAHIDGNDDWNEGTRAQAKEFFNKADGLKQDLLRAFTTIIMADSADDSITGDMDRVEHQMQEYETNLNSVAV